ncbi:unnamed protein product [Haemonchus placei]|uniref:SCP domain-containing protein n=1 Tax=Haemonchus placei TaxID=6290 RepID=A0A0N4W790_HAEPC|nr:unnamed protein product [Haemonchus placei]
MLLIFTVISCFLLNVASYETLNGQAKSAFKELSVILNRKIDWSDELEKRALEYLQSPGSVKADVIIKGKKTFPKDDSSPLGVKTWNTFKDRFKKNEKKVRNLPEGSKYGCNLIFKTTAKNQILNGVCLYYKKK